MLPLLVLAAGGLRLAHATAPPQVSAVCAARLTAWCNTGTNCAIGGRPNPHQPSTTCGSTFTALNSTASPLYDDAYEWRCYSNTDIDAAHTHYINGSCYCSRAKQLEQQLCLCRNPADPKQCGPVPPSPPAPPPPPPPQSPEPGVTAFTGGEEGYGWFFFPRLLQTPGGELLVFSEAHVACTASDRGAIDIVMKRSSDGGATWGSVDVVHSERKDKPGTWIGNPAPLIDEEKKTLWLVMSRNNTDVLAMHSADWGKSWSVPVVISGQVLAPQWRSKPSWQGGWGWVATTGGVQLKGPAEGAIGSPRKGRLLVVGDVQTPATQNCSSPYSNYKYSQGRRGRQGRGWLWEGNGERERDGKSCSQTVAMYSDDHGLTWNYSHTLLLPGDEVANPVELANGAFDCHYPVELPVLKHCQPSLLWNCRS